MVRAKQFNDAFDFTTSPIMDAHRELGLGTDTPSPSDLYLDTLSRHLTPALEALPEPFEHVGSDAHHDTNA